METINSTKPEPVIMCERDLIDDIKLGVEVEQLPPQFTTSDIAEWMEKYQIKRLDGTSYPPISLELLSNYSLHTPITKKRKQKVLYMDLTGRIFSFIPF